MARDPKYRLHPAGRTTIDHSTLGAYLEAEQHTIVHDDELTIEEKVIALHTIARLARSISGHWSNVSNYYGESAERVWFRMAGLDREGMPTHQMIGRVVEVTAFESDDDGNAGPVAAVVA